MSVKVIENGMVFQDAKNLYITPYTDANTVGDSTYDIRAIVADSMSIEQDDNSVNTKDWEFGDSPLLENTTLGKFQFSATCVDFQNEIMMLLFGYKQLGDGAADDTKIITAPTIYKDLYVAVRIVFEESASKDIIIPKLKLNSKAVIGTLKTGSAEGTISGTAYTTTVQGAPASSGGTGPKEETTMFMAPNAMAEGISSTWLLKSKVTSDGTTTDGFKAINYAPTNTTT